MVVRTEINPIKQAIRDFNQCDSSQEAANYQCRKPPSGVLQSLANQPE